MNYKQIEKANDIIENVRILNEDISILNDISKLIVSKKTKNTITINIQDLETEIKMNDIGSNLMSRAVGMSELASMINSINSKSKVYEVSDYSEEFSEIIVIKVIGLIVSEKREKIKEYEQALKKMGVKKR